MKFDQVHSKLSIRGIYLSIVAIMRQHLNFQPRCISLSTPQSLRYCSALPVNQHLLQTAKKERSKVRFLKNVRRD